MVSPNPTTTQQPSSAAAASSDVASLPFKQFVWGAGIECSFLPHLNVDQFEWTQHDRFWREDLQAREGRAGHHPPALRVAVARARAASAGKFDWTYADERIAEFEQARHRAADGRDALRHAAVAEAGGGRSGVSRSAGAIHRGDGRRATAAQIKTWCPFNEPLVSALFSGDFGFWPPHSRKWRGYMPVLSRIVQAVNRGIRAIRRAMPEATVLLCDAAENYKTRDESLQTEVQRRNLRRFVVMDLLLGRVDQATTRCSPWLTSYGMSELDLEWFRHNPQSPDVLGLDYYPHSDWQLDSVGGGVRQRRADNPVGLYGVAQRVLAAATASR